MTHPHEDTIRRWLPLAEGLARKMEQRYPDIDAWPVASRALEKAAATFDPSKGSFPAYLRKNMRNESSGPIRLWKRRHPLRNRLPSILEHARTIDPGYKAVDDRDECRRPLAILDSGDAEAAEMVRRYCQGETQDEIAASYGRSRNYVYTKITRATQRVRELMTA